MVRKFRVEKLTDLELQEHPEDEKSQLLYVNQKEFIVKDGSFYMDFNDIDFLKEKRKEALEQANNDTTEAQKILVELMKDAPKKRFEYIILVGDNYRNMKDILTSLE